MDNKRSSPRIRRRLKVTLAAQGAFTADVSMGGFCVEMMRVVAPGSEVEGTLSDGKSDVPFRGVVRWAKAGDARIGKRGRMGVRFLEVSAALRALLETAIQAK